MDLIFFDLDGTLLNSQSEISSFTKETLLLLSEKDIAFTVATGRTMLSAKSILEGHAFVLPHIYNNGVTVWDPKSQQLTLDNILSDDETHHIIEVALAHNITPFINVITEETSQNQCEHIVFHPQAQHEVEKQLISKYFMRTHAKVLPLESLPKGSQVTNISMIANASTIDTMWLKIKGHDKLVAYSGPAHEGKQYKWMDVHHCLANKGTAVSNLKTKLGAQNVICFGDSDNDKSMFALADESYAPANAQNDIKDSATSVIGHNHEDGIAHFLRDRFSL